MVKIYKQPFAHDGDTIAIPDASQPDGQMSSADGWTPDYQLPKTDPNYKPVGRQEMNGVFKEVTEALGQVQVQGAASWSADGAPYPINAQVYHNGKQWIALRANSVEPVEGEDWKGALRPATPEQAQELTAVDVAITPETLGAAMSAHVLGMGQAWQVVTSSRLSGTTYTNTTGRAIAISVTSIPITSTTAKTQLNLFLNGIQVARSSVPGANVGDGTNAWVAIIVPPGDTYQLTSVAGSIQTWLELR